MRMVKSLPIRSEVPLEETWNLRDLFESEEDFSALLLEIEEEVNDFEKKFKGKIDNPTIIIDALKGYSSIYEKLVPSGTYASLSLSTDQTNTEAQLRSSKFASLSAKVNSKLSFINSELVELPNEILQK